MQNPQFYPDPLEFNGFRFVSPADIDNAAGNFKLLQAKSSKLTDVDETFHVWGTGRMAWYVYHCSLVARIAPKRHLRH